MNLKQGMATSLWKELALDIDVNQVQNSEGLLYFLVLFPLLKKYQKS